jgi:hypothetical protein
MNRRRLGLVGIATVAATIFLLIAGRNWAQNNEANVQFHALQREVLSVTIVSRDGTMADALSKAAFILGPSVGLTLVDSFPGASAVIAYRWPDGTIALAISSRLRAAFHPSATQ